MIENLLVDPDTIFHATETVRHKTDLRSVEEVARAIDGILDDMQGHEVARRVKSSVPAKTFRLSDPIDTARSQVEEFASLLLDEVSQERFEQIRTQAEIAVTALETARRRREFFDGKYLINTFFARYIHATGLSKEIFVYLCAKEAARRTSVSKFADGLFTSLAVQSSL